MASLLLWADAMSLALLTPRRFFIFVVGALAITQVHAADLDGSSDYPGMSRIKDSTILGYDLRDYDIGEFITDFRESERELDNMTVEGERGRWIYLAPAGRAGLGVLRNYQAILEGMGDVTNVYECAKSTCPSNLGKVVFNRDNSFKTTLGSDSQWLYHQPSYYSDQLYLYATVAGADTSFHISIYIATQTDRSHSANKELRGRTLVHLQIVTPEEFEADLELVTANDMTQAITEKGHIALYGIYFDTDKADLKPESDPTILEIATFLKSDSTLSIYVVGHTDNVGDVVYNQTLAMQRAESVVDELVEKHGIANTRLAPLGAGLMAPVASNETDEGKALNRRVVLVRQ